MLCGRKTSGRRTGIFFWNGSFCVKNEIGFRIVCTCGCLSIRIEEPLKASREAIVYCGDCGASRGTVGALRDLAVQRHPDVISSAPLPVPPYTPRMIYTTARNFRSGIPNCGVCASKSKLPNLLR